jgi:hypothetical protein
MNPTAGLCIEAGLRIDRRGRAEAGPVKSAQFGGETGGS